MNNIRDLLHIPSNRTLLSGYFISILFLAIIKRFHLVTDEYFSSVIIFLIFTSLFFARESKFRTFAHGISGGTATVALLWFLVQAYTTLFEIRQFDFLCFYLFGKVGVSGLDFYNPANFAAVFSGLNIPIAVHNDFIEEIIKVGFWYPPPAMILFAPLGYFNNIETANLVWKSIVLLFLLFDIILIIRILNSYNMPKIWIISIIGLVLIFPGTISTIEFGQTNFLLLFIILLAYRNLDNWKSGIYLALAIIVKPLAAIWCLYLIINKKWSSLISLTITGLIIVLLSGIFFGFTSFLSYLNSPPTLRIPQWVYTESINKSLNATILRFGMKHGFDFFVSNGKTLFIICSGLLTIFTCIGSYKLARTYPVYSFLLFIPLSLVIYPGSLKYYSVYLIPVFLEIFAKKNLRWLLTLSVLMLLLLFSEFLTSIFILIYLIVFSFLPSEKKLYLIPDAGKV
jgi:hypothetical protein